jgi:hypothetical protein
MTAALHFVGDDRAGQIERHKKPFVDDEIWADVNPCYCIGIVFNAPQQ